MLDKICRLSRLLAGSAVLSLAVANATFAKTQQAPEGSIRQIDIVIALDVSGSMSGLIASAKQRLWDIVNQLGRAQPQPELRISIMSFGNPAYGSDTGYVKVNLPFTSDLDAVNETLFGFGTNGGDEYVARTVMTSVNELAWSTRQDALRILFVAGNEAATQDPQVTVRQATQAAISRGIIVNTIYCGNNNDTVSAGWREVAAMTNGIYASIDQDSAAVANVVTPMDKKLTELNEALNGTYLPFGESGTRFRDNQLEQDKNAGEMSSTAIASRVVTKAGRLYDSSQWDLVDAVNSGLPIDELEVEDLPAQMRTMDDEERVVFVRLQAERREGLQAEIHALAKDRRDFIDNERRSAAAVPAGLDEVIQEGLKTIAEQKGFTFED